MWLDGLFMAAPFLTEYALLFHEPEALEDVVHQFVLIERHTRDSATGLLFHGWDESRAQRWADPVTGRSPAFWGRSMGWYAMALVDVLDLLPATHPRRGELTGILRRLAAAVVRVQDSATGLWYQVPDQPGREGNYLESSASAMFAYAFTRGVQTGALDTTYAGPAARAFRGLTELKVSVSAGGFIDLHDICRSAGLGGKPYRDGSFAYYISEPRRMNDMKGYGPLLRAAIRLEQAAGRTPR
jgi:unsaturated rhamnogalacturonyl hydrolase